MALCSVGLYAKPSLVLLVRPILNLFITSQGRRRGDSFIPDSVPSNAWPIILLITMAAVNRLIYVTQSPIHPLLSQLHLFPVILLTPSPLPMGLATKILMMSLTSDPSVGNYNICRHDKAAHKDGSGTLFWGSSSSPLIMSGFWGDAELVGSDGRGFATLCGKKGPPHNTDRHVDSKHKHSKTNGSRLPL